MKKIFFRMLMIYLFGLFTSIQAADTTISDNDFEIPAAINFGVDALGWTTFLWTTSKPAAQHYNATLITSTIVVMLSPHIYYSWRYKLTTRQHLKLIITSIQGIGIASILYGAIVGFGQKNQSN